MPSVSKIALAISLSLTVCTTAASAASDLVRDDLGIRAAARPTTVVVVLAHRNQPALFALLAAIAAGRAKPIGHAEFVRDFAPSQAARGTVTRFLSASGFTIVRNGEDAIEASASAAIVNRTLATSIHDVRAETRGDWYAPMSVVRIPVTLAPLVSSVVASNLPVHRAR